MPSATGLWTIGHSTRPLEDFLTLLRAHGVQQLVDVRTIPRSCYNPQFNADRLTKALHDAGLAYRHMRELGGLRKPKKESVNLGWRTDGFRGYADYMQTQEFWDALQELMVSSSIPTAIMCAEAVPWRCHRSLIADALVSRGWTVRHILSKDKADPHTLTAFARIENGLVIYPAPTDPGKPLRLF